MQQRILVFTSPYDPKYYSIYWFSGDGEKINKIKSSSGYKYDRALEEELKKKMKQGCK